METSLKGRVLLIDDSETIRAVIGNQLRAAGYDPLFASSALEALHVLESQTPSAILLDINLPDLDGYTVCRRIKRDPRTYHIPVLVLTSMSGTESELAAIEAGADDFIPKPPQPRVLEARLQMHIKRSERERSSNPLTGLPGNVLIEQRLAERFTSGRPMCLAYIDLDDFKAYNDHYGYQRGDGVILLAGGIIISAVDAAGGAGDFVGHIGGDDFVVLTEPECIPLIAARVTKMFDEAIGEFYDDETRARGWFDSVDRRGNHYRVPLMSISIASVDSTDRDFETSLEMVDTVTELKHRAKTIPGSVHVSERRHSSGHREQAAAASEG